jgi:NMT1/THI5 like
VANNRFLEKNPEAVRGFLKGWARATQDATANPQEADERQVATPTVHGTGAVLATCSDDPRGSFFGQGVLLRRSERGSKVVVSVLGQGEVNQRLVVVLANHLHLTPSSVS